MSEMKIYHRTTTGGLACYKDSERDTVEGVNQLLKDVVEEVEFFHTYKAPVLILIQGGKA